MIVKEAGEREVDALLALWIEKSRSLIERGLGLWDPAQFTRDRLREAYGEPAYLICRAEGRAAGGFILIERDDRYWPEKRGDDAFYIHKLAVRDEFAGRGCADFMLDWIKAYGRERGKVFLRLDFDHERERVRDLYLRNGFAVTEILDTIPGRIMAKAELRL
jgi:ribosomal protein S18 acetylase RimI-like enzyme